MNRKGVQRKGGQEPKKNIPKDKVEKFVPKDITFIHEYEKDAYIRNIRCKVYNVKCCHCDNLVEHIAYRCDRCEDVNDNHPDYSGVVCEDCKGYCKNPKQMSYYLQRLLNIHLE